MQWTRKERVEMMKTGGLKGVVGYMGAGFGGEQWNAIVDSWALAIAEAGEVRGLAEGEVTFPALIRRCSAAIKKGVAWSFFSMVSYVQLFLKSVVYVLFPFLLITETYIYRHSYCRSPTRKRPLSVRRLWELEVKTLSSPTYEPPSYKTFEDYYTLGGKYATVAAGGSSFFCLSK